MFIQPYEADEIHFAYCCRVYARFLTHRSAPHSALAKVDAALLNELMDPYEIHILKCATDSTDLLVELSLRQFETISAALGKLKGRISKWLNEPTDVK